MSRRCDREGEEWPRLTHLDSLVRRAYRTLDALALIGHERRAWSMNPGNHARLLEHLRERPALPLAPLPPQVCPSPLEGL